MLTVLAMARICSEGNATRSESPSTVTWLADTGSPRAGGRFVTEKILHKALIQIEGVWMGSGASRSSNLRRFLDTLDASDRMDVVTVWSRIEVRRHGERPRCNPHAHERRACWPKRVLCGLAAAP